MEKDRIATTTQASPILIVDDDIPIAEVLAEFVRELGYSALVAYNGQQALALAREQWPVLVITDQMMPLLSGSDLIRELQKEAAAQQRAMPFVVLVSVTAAEITGVPVNARFTKPFDLRDLEQVIQRFRRGVSSEGSSPSPE